MGQALDDDDNLEQGRRQFHLDLGHDLRGPLAGIRMLTALAQRHLGEGDVAAALQSLQRIADQVQLSQRTLEALWRLADPLERPLEPRLCDLDALARAAAAEAVRSLEVQAPGRRLPHQRLQPLGRALVDAGLVHVILVNLIGNALKFNLDHEAVCVSVSREAVEPQAAPSHHATPSGAGAGLVLVVRDNGAGFAVGEPEPASERSGYSGGASGTGLGLDIVRRAARRMGGWIQIESAPGQGTAVRLSLPTAA